MENKMSVRIIFETHSTTLDNEAGLASGWHDVDLSDLGVRQSADLGKRRNGEKFDAIFCSDLIRGKRTAEIAFAATGAPIMPDARLRECDYGDMTRAPSSEVELQKPQRIAVPFPNGESYEGATKRVGEFLSDLRKNFEGKKVLIIGHRATQYGLENLINGRPLQELVAAKFAWQPGWEYEL
jgi:broad specificity phosphatase PhoE